MSHPDRFFLCPPSFFGVEYVINPWMEGNVGRADPAVAMRQWEAFREALATRARIEIVEPGPGLPDMAFAANAGLVVGDAFIPSRFRFRERRPETPRFLEWFRQHDYRIVELPGEGTFEGEGDALFQPGEALLWGGYGVRTSLQVYSHLAELLEVEVVPLRLVDERFYHLDTCFCPLPGGRLVYYPDAFDAESRSVITTRIAPENRFEVGPTDARHFACNAVAMAGAFLTNFATDALRARLTTWGFETVVRPLTEFILAGGAAKCLVLRLTHDLPEGRARGEGRAASPVCDRMIELQGHLLDSGLMNRVLDAISEAGCGFEIEAFQPGLRHDENSWARVRLAAPTPEKLDSALGRAMQLGAHVVEAETDVRLEPVEHDGVAPSEFYSTTIYPTEVRIDGRWVRVDRQRMDAVIMVHRPPASAAATCRLFRDLKAGDNVVCGVEGVRIHATAALASGRSREAFSFMSAQVSSERRVELSVERIAWEMRRVRERLGKIVVVAGPVVIHTGGSPHLASLIRRGYVQALLAGNGFAVHDIEQALFGTSLGVDLRRGARVEGGHRHHLRAINLVRGCGGIDQAVSQGLLRRGVMYECIRNHVPFALAGSIRDDGPLPETHMNLIAAQEAYARLIEHADMILMLSSMLHAIGVGNMTPAGVRLICVDISPAVVTKLADRGSVESTGVVTDVGLFLNLLDTSLGDGAGNARTAPEGEAPAPGEGA